MDIALPQLDTKTLADQGIVVPLNDLAGNPAVNPSGEPITLTLYGADSEIYRKASRVLARKRVERAQKGGTAVTDEAMDQAEADAIELLVGCTKSFSGFVDSKGKPVEFSAAAVRHIYTAFPAIRDQADRAIVDRTRFILPSSEG